MTLQELCKKYNYSESTIKNKWTQVQKTVYNKTGVTLIKEGRGKNTIYKEEISTDNRAMVIFEEVKDSVIMDKSAFSYENLEFICFLGIVLTPLMVFRGTYIDLARYLGMKTDNNTLNQIKEAVESLQDRNIVFIYKDLSVKRELVTITLVGKAEDEMKIGIEMIKICKELADKNHKHSWVPLLKTWLGIQIMVEDQPFTMAELQQLTGLSAYQIRESKKLLENNEVFKSSKAYRSFNHCVGQIVDLNAFVKDN